MKVILMILFLGLTVIGVNSISCGSGYEYDQGFVLKDGRCVQCPLGCGECESPDECKKCIVGYGITSDGKCKQCLSDLCLDCDENGACLRCDNGTLSNTDGSPLAVALVGGECVKCEDEVGSECKKCTATTPCINPYSRCRGEITCVECNEPAELTSRGNYLQRCIGGGMKCSTCPVGCRECTDETRCTVCLDGYFYTGGGVCQACLNNCAKCKGVGTCEKCKPGHYFDTENCFCEPCGSNCMECTSSTTCQKCNEEYYLSGSTCSKCIDHCLECADGTSCNKCDQYFDDYRNYKCNPNCPIGRYYYAALDTCSGCSSSCKTCNKVSTNCTSCPDDKYFNPAKSSFQCVTCESNCVRCKSLTECEVCKEGYFAEADGKCEKTVGNCVVATPGKETCECGVCQKASQECYVETYFGKLDASDYSAAVTKKMIGGLILGMVSLVLV